MPKTILIIGDAASGKSALAAFLATRLGSDCVFEGESKNSFRKRLIAARRDQDAWCYSEGFVKVADDFPHANTYSGIDDNDASAVSNFVQRQVADGPLAFILTAHSRDNVVRGHSVLFAKFDVVLHMVREDSGLRRVVVRKDKDGDCMWGGLYSLKVEPIGDLRTIRLVKEA